MVSFCILLAVLFSSGECINGKAQVSSGISVGVDFTKASDSFKTWTNWANLPEATKVSAGVYGNIDLSEISGIVNPWNIWGNLKKLPKVFGGVSGGVSGGVDFLTVAPTTTKNSAGVSEGVDFPPVSPTTAKLSASSTVGVDFTTVVPTTAKVTVGEDDATTEPTTANVRPCVSGLHTTFYEHDIGNELAKHNRGLCNDHLCNQMCIHASILSRCGYCHKYPDFEWKMCKCDMMYTNDEDCIPNESDECKEACKKVNYIPYDQFCSVPSKNLSCVCGYSGFLWNYDTSF